MFDQVIDFARDLLPSNNISAFSTNAEIVAGFGERVREERMRCNLSRKELADRSGISERYIHIIEKGKGNVSIVLLFRLAAAIQRSG